MKSAQHGVVLLVSLVMLLLLTIIAIAAASHANLQLRISSNSQLQNIAFQQAESGLQNWANLYFSRPDPNPEQLGIQAATQGNGRYSAEPAILGNGTVFAEGYSVGDSSVRIYRFEVIGTGDACGSADGDCDVTAIHRQGFQKRSY